MTSGQSAQRRAPASADDHHAEVCQRVSRSEPSSAVLHKAPPPRFSLALASPGFHTVHHRLSDTDSAGTSCATCASAPGSEPAQAPEPTTTDNQHMITAADGVPTHEHADE